MLCRKCQEKVESENISEADIKISKTILNLSEKIRSLKDITIKRTVILDSMIVIVCGKGDATSAIGRGGIVVKKLEKELGRQVKVVEEAKDVKEFITNLFHPVHVEGINNVYRSDGEALKVIIKKKRGFFTPSKELGKIVKSMYGKDIELSYE